MKTVLLAFIGALAAMVLFAAAAQKVGIGIKMNGLYVGQAETLSLTDDSLVVGQFEKDCSCADARGVS
jgi:hypothetical protein